MKPLNFALPLLLLSLSPLQQANASVTSQTCYDTYSSDYYNPELISTTCTTSATYALGGTASLNYSNGSPFTTLGITGAMSQNETVTTETSGYSYGQLYTTMTLSFTGLGTYSMTRLDEMGWGITSIGAVTNSLTGGYTTDNTTQWDIWSDGVNAIALTLDGDANGKNGFNVYLNGVKTYVADVHVASIPEAETYAMMLAGLGLVGFIGKRRKQAEA